MMHMTFYWSREVTLLFDSWRTQSWTSYALTLLACFIAAALYRFLEARRIGLKLRLISLSSSSRATTNDGPSDAPLTTTLLSSRMRKIGSSFDRCRSLGRVVEGILFGVNAAIGYLLMLAVMSFNGGVFVSIVCGLAVGFLAFRSSDDEVAKVVVGSDDNACSCA